MKFCWVTLNVNNLEESLKFYTEIVGLPINRRFTSGSSIEIVFLGNDQTRLELLFDKNNDKTKIGNDISLGFEVESVEKMITFLKEKSIEIESGPFSPNPSIKFFYVRDPNGLKIQFVENISLPVH